MSGTERTKSVLYMLLNVISSIALVFTNKAVFDYPELRGMPMLFTAFHFAFTALGLYVFSRPFVGLFEAKYVSWKKMLPISLAFAQFVVSTNLSLAFNSVAFYQMAKVLTTPVIVVINLVFYRKYVSLKVASALGCTCLGVACTIAGEFGTSIPGTIFAGTGVLVTSVYQIWIGTKQKQFDVTSSQLLLNQAPSSALMLLIVAPFSDSIPTFSSVPAAGWVAFFFSGVIALLVNLSQFLIIGKTSAVTYNVVGHMKTCIIVTAGWAMANQAVATNDIVGVLLAIGGALAYTYYSMAPAIPPPAPTLPK